MFSSSSKVYQISVNSSPSPQSQKSQVVYWAVLFSVKEMHLNKFTSHIIILFSSAIVSCSLQGGDHRKRLMTEAAIIRSKSHRQLFVRRSPQKDLRQKPQVFVAKAIVYCSSGDHRKRVTTEAARIRSKAIVIVYCSSGVHRKRVKTEAASIRSKAIVIIYCSSGVHRKRVTTEAVSISSSSIVRRAFTAKESRQKPQVHRHRLLFVGRSPQKSHDSSRKYSQHSHRHRLLFVGRSPQKIHDRSRKYRQQSHCHRLSFFRRCVRLVNVPTKSLFK